MNKEKTPQEIVGARVRIARLARNLNQVQLADQIQSSQNYISDLEKGKTDPKLTMLLKLADALGVSVDWLAMQELPARSLFAAEPRESYEVESKNTAAKRRKAA